MTKKFFLYADRASRDVLANEKEKILLVGGDFGYGNFGDVLQHVNALRTIREGGRYQSISVFSLDAITSGRFPQWARSMYATDAVIFASAVELHVDQADPGLEPVGVARGLSGLWLYGGGFLNTMWGEFVLSVVEYFLDCLHGISYWMSGQQVTSPFETRVMEHVAHYRPTLLGVRDQLSVALLQSAGCTPGFSFDDATEALLELGERVVQVGGNGLLLHVNISDYTANQENLAELGDELALMNRKLAAGDGVTVLQAFRDRRESVGDAREAIKWLESDFPFADYRLVELTRLCYPGSRIDLNPRLSGAFGYSCSYHVALWLQLAGIPCYLRSRNPFYDQKAKALGVPETFREYLESPRLTDHRENLERRSEWMETITRALAAAPEIRTERRFESPDGNGQRWPYHFKGTPTREQQLQWWTGHAESLQQEIGRQSVRADEAEHEATTRADQLLRLKAESDDLRVRLKNLETGFERQREQTLAAESRLAAVQAHNEAIQARIDSILNSRSWRLTRAYRFLGRILRGEMPARDERRGPPDRKDPI